MATSSSAIFRPTSPGQAVATLFIIENSRAMFPAWPHLRDHHIPTLLGAMRVANPVVPIQILLLTSCPAPEEPIPNASASPRQFYDLPDVRFNYHPDNKISAHNIERGIQLLTSIFNGLPTTRHIIIIAASGPLEDLDVFQTSKNGVTERQILAQKLVQEGIHCHMILKPNHETEPFANLFYDALRLQRNKQVPPWFPSDSQAYQFYLSARSASPIPRYEAASASSAVHVPSVYPLHRNYTYPPDGQSAGNTEEKSTPSDVQSDMRTPSLVSRLQKMHGLTKKKIYGTQPPREPFFRSERIRDKYRQTPTPLAIPSSAHLAGTGTGREATLKSKVDRTKRLNEKILPTSFQPDSSTSSRRLSPRSHRNSRVSSPEIDSPLSSPTSVSRYSSLSPVVAIPSDLGNYHSNLSSPVTPSGDYLYTQQPIPELSERLTLESSAPTPTSLGTLSGDWSEIRQPPLPLTPGHPVVPLQAPFPLSAPYNGNALGVGIDVGDSPFIMDVALPSSSYQYVELLTNPTGNGSNTSFKEDFGNESIIPGTGTVPVDDGDRPFIFCPEYEAAAAARLQVLKSTTSNLHMPNFTSVNTSTDSALSITESPANRGRHDNHTNTYPHPLPVLSPPQVESSYGNSAMRPPPLGQSYSIQASRTTANMPASHPISSSSSLHGWGG